MAKGGAEVKNAIQNVKTSMVKRLSSISLRTLGIIGIFEEAILQKGERPTLLIIFASMLGLPTFLATDKKLTPKSAEKSVEPESTGPPPREVVLHE